MNDRVTREDVRGVRRQGCAIMSPDVDDERQRLTGVVEWKMARTLEMTPRTEGVSWSLGERLAAVQITMLGHIAMLP